jgi:hypothetical protein
MSKEKTTGFYFKATPKEMELIKQAQAASGINNLSAYIRKQATNGYVLRLNLPELPECRRLLLSAANNLNQLAKVANTNGQIHIAQIIETQELLNENRALFGKILELLAKVS